jgi:hypothetical protein
MKNFWNFIGWSAVLATMILLVSCEGSPCGCSEPDPVFVEHTITAEITYNDGSTETKDFVTIVKEGTRPNLHLHSEPNKIGMCLHMEHEENPKYQACSVRSYAEISRTTKSAEKIEEQNGGE